MEFGILFISHPDKEREPYPHHEVMPAFRGGGTTP
jgi:hypothetical protein